MKTKLKTHRGAAKRVRRSATGKLMIKRAGNRHLLAHKSARRKRGYHLPVVANPSDQKNLKKLLPYLT